MPQETIGWSTAAIDSVITVGIKSVGHKRLKTEQHRIVSAFVSGRDVFVALPTGFGKNFCYGCLPGVFDCLKGMESKSSVVVVTPLVAITHWICKISHIILSHASATSCVVTQEIKFLCYSWIYAELPDPFLP